MQKQIAVLSQKEKNITLSLKKYFENKNVNVYTTDSPLKAMDSDLCIVDEFYGHISNNILEESIFIKLHNSLLPAFDCENPIEKAFKAGVKVSGITICYLNPDGTNGTIIAQYPSFIEINTTTQDFETELFRIKEKLTPFVAESILNDKIFDFSELLKNNNCSGSCGNCH